MVKRIITALIGCALIMLFCPFGIQKETNTVSLSLGLCGIVIVLLIIDEIILSYVFKLPPKEEYDYPYHKKRNNTFQFTNVVVLSTATIIFMNILGRNNEDNEYLSVKFIGHTFAIYAFCSYLIGKGWKIRYKNSKNTKKRKNKQELTKKDIIKKWNDILIFCHIKKKKKLKPVEIDEYILRLIEDGLMDKKGHWTTIPITHKNQCNTLATPMQKAYWTEQYGGIKKIPHYWNWAEEHQGQFNLKQVLNKSSYLKFEDCPECREMDKYLYAKLWEEYQNSKKSQIAK